jgi:hypothetical protein
MLLGLTRHPAPHRSDSIVRTVTSSDLNARTTAYEAAGQLHFISCYDVVVGERIDIERARRDSGHGDVPVVHERKGSFGSFGIEVR